MIFLGGDCDHEDLRMKRREDRGCHLLYLMRPKKLNAAISEENVVVCKSGILMLRKVDVMKVTQ